MITLEDAIIMFKEKGKSAIWKSNRYFICIASDTNGKEVNGL